MPFSISIYYSCPPLHKHFLRVQYLLEVAGDRVNSILQFIASLVLDARLCSLFCKAFSSLVLGSYLWAVELRITGHPAISVHLWTPFSLVCLPHSAACLTTLVNSTQQSEREMHVCLQWKGGCLHCGWLNASVAGTD